MSEVVESKPARTARRRGPKCSECGGYKKVSGTPSDPAVIAAKKAKLQAQLAKLGIAELAEVVPFAKKEDESPAS